MDFLVREVRAVTTGPLRIIRLGSCAGLRPDLPVGTVAVASEGSLFISQNPDAWAAARTVPTAPDGSSSSASREPYVFHGVAEADEELSNALLQELERSMGGETEVVGCLNASADSFYSSQGESGLWPREPLSRLTCVVGTTLRAGMLILRTATSLRRYVLLVALCGTAGCGSKPVKSGNERVAPLICESQSTIAHDF